MCCEADDAAYAPPPPAALEGPARLAAVLLNRITRFCRLSFRNLWKISGRLPVNLCKISGRSLEDFGWWIWQVLDADRLRKRAHDLVCVLRHRALNPSVTAKQNQRVLCIMRRAPLRNRKYDAHLTSRCPPEPGKPRASWHALNQTCHVMMQS